MLVLQLDLLRAYVILLLHLAFQMPVCLCIVNGDRLIDYLRAMRLKARTALDLAAFATIVLANIGKLDSLELQLQHV